MMSHTQVDTPNDNRADRKYLARGHPHFLMSLAVDHPLLHGLGLDTLRPETDISIGLCSCATPEELILVTARIREVAGPLQVQLGLQGVVGRPGLLNHRLQGLQDTHRLLL